MILFYLSNLTSPTINQTNKYNTTIIFFNPAATSFWLYYCGFKRIIKGIKEKRVLRPKTVVERRIFFFCFITSKLHHCRYREAGLLINFLLPFYYPIISPLYYPLLPTLIQYYTSFLLLYIINMRVEKKADMIFPCSHRIITLNKPRITTIKHIIRPYSIDTFLSLYHLTSRFLVNFNKGQ